MHMRGESVRLNPLTSRSSHPIPPRCYLPCLACVLTQIGPAAACSAVPFVATVGFFWCGLLSMMRGASLGAIEQPQQQPQHQQLAEDQLRTIAVRSPSRSAL